MGLFRGKVPAEAARYAAASWDRLYPAAYSLTGRKADAEDLVQEVLAKVMTNWEHVDRADSPDAYVRTMLVRTFLSARRRKSSTEVVHEDPGSLAVRATGDPSGGVVERTALWRLLATLSPQQRAVLVLRYYEDLPDSAIAELVGTSVGNVRVLAHRALARLRPQVEEVGSLER